MSYMNYAERFGVEKEAYFFSFILWRRERTKRHPPNPSPSLYGRGVTDFGGKPPCVRGLVWLTKPVPLRGEPWSFYRLRRVINYKEGLYNFFGNCSIKI